MNNEALSVANLSFAYAKNLILDEVSFTVKSGHCCLLLGPNGAGKSTLFALLTRLYDTQQGKIYLQGFDIKKQTRKALAGLGVVFQQTTLDMDLSVLQNLRYHATLHGIGRKQANLRIQEELERLAMYERRFEKIRQLNGGHRRRVEIARALLHKPALLLLDEPTIGLDVSTRQVLVEYIHGLASDQGMAVFWASHLIDEVYADDDVLVLHQGKIRAAGSVNDVIKQVQAENIKDAFKKLTLAKAVQ